MKTTEGQLDAKDLRVSVVVSRYNSMITSRLLTGAKEAFARLGGSDDGVHVVKVPGSFEIPLAAKKLADSKKYDAVVCLGAVIRGETLHFDYVAAEVAKGIAKVATDSGVPVTFGVITADTLDQAVSRAGAKQGNKGEEAMMAAVEMANLLKQL